METTRQQILALDVKYSSVRTPFYPTHRTLYMRRRSQLFREIGTTSINNDGGNSIEELEIRRNYIFLRNEILLAKYGYVQNSRTTSISNALGFAGSHESGINKMTRKFHFPNARLRSATLKERERPRTSSLDKELAVSYAFAGMYYIYDKNAGPVTRVKFSNEEKNRLACCCADGTLTVMTVNKKSSVSETIIKLVGHTGPVQDLDWSMCNDFIVSCSEDKTLRCWTPTNGNCLRAMKDPFKSPIVCCKFHPINNNLLVAGNQKGVLYLVNVSTGKDLRDGYGRLGGSVLTIAFDQNGSMFWCSDDKGYVYAFKLNYVNGNIQKAKRTPVCSGYAINCLSYKSWVTKFGRDPCLLLSCQDNTIKLYEISESNGALKKRQEFSVTNFSQSIQSTFCPLMSSHGGGCVVSGSEDTSVIIYSIETRSIVNKLQGHTAAVIGICWNYNESLLASCDTNGTVIVWQREHTKDLTSSLKY